jgi:hypothetical protein
MFYILGNAFFILAWAIEAPGFRREFSSASMSSLFNELELYFFFPYPVIFHHSKTLLLSPPIHPSPILMMQSFMHCEVLKPILQFNYQFIKTLTQGLHPFVAAMQASTIYCPVIRMLLSYGHEDHPTLDMLFAMVKII